MKTLMLIIGVLLMTVKEPAAAKQDTTAHSFEFAALMADEPIKLSDFAGKVVLIVNTASKCGFTGQYDGLEEVYQLHKDEGLVVVGVPSNNFGKQEPGSREEIASFCKINYGVTFPMTSKYSVSGDDAHPFYKWAHDELGFGTAPKWNFHKYIIGKDGKLVDYFHSNISPKSKRITKAITEALDH
jgi:glutathione peroxidase